MSASSPIDGVILGRISITRVLTKDDTVDVREAIDGNGEPLELSEALSMLAMAQHSIAYDRLSDD